MHLRGNTAERVYSVKLYNMMECQTLPILSTSSEEPSRMNIAYVLQATNTFGSRLRRWNPRDSLSCSQYSIVNLKFNVAKNIALFQKDLFLQS